MTDLPLPARPDEPPIPATDAVGGLDHLALLVVAGADARTFLDSQLTRNVPVDALGASPAGYCSPKGRLLATFVVWTEDDGGVRLLVARDIADGIARRLRMYVLRAKATIADVTANTAIDGIVGASVFGDADPWQVRRVDGATWIRFPHGDGGPRFLRVAPTRDDTTAAVDSSTWRWLDLRAGLATVRAATQDRFVPQMLNLEALGGVDFKKGCYPGQEVVARSQYLGKLKRRMALASLDAAADVPAAGADIHAADRAEPVGVVVDAERGADGRVALLAELPVALFAAHDLKAGSVDGATLTVEPLPYPLPDNEVFVRPKL